MIDEQTGVLDRCPPLKPIIDRPLISPEQAGRLEAVFKVLANSTRLRMLHALVREPDLSVGALAETIAMKPQAVSNQLRRLVDRGIVGPRRDGNNIRYRVVDACTVGLLDQGFCLAACVDSGTGIDATAASSEAAGAASRTGKT